ncbi:efflux RND transporter periplasmic adaptor subunit [Christiangramia fulva]|uniref:Efflux RND transporter periplasmic adaptor subunit n=1 Tax=Christiangramia fulva TaxID=2126553 RepID=A0A2R3ZB96_9FLAO|nr:efflux RND transporter periplasmic adaptor subunit [Christiangramia fulva]AVR47462.1 efflux RND transporter periplasmic adaptor subunit [Christiangramia fulva]
MKKIIYFLIVALISGISLSCGNETHTSEVKSDPIKVRLSTPDTVKDTFLTASGKIEAVENAKLSTRMMGYIHKIYVNIGDRVKKGELLVSINNTDLQAKLAQVNARITEAEAAFKNAKKDYERYQALFEENSASQKEMDDMSANYEMAKARLEAARQMKNEIQSQFTYANIRAPFSGVITNKFVEEGAMANPGMPLLAMEAPGKFEMKAMIPEADISQIKPETDVLVLIKTLDKTVQGKVTEVGSSASNTGGQYPVKISLEETTEGLRSGMYATVQFPVESPEQKNKIVFVPKNVLTYRGDLTGLYTVSSEGTAILRWIRPGRTIGDQVEILSGLEPEEPYITSSNGKITNGSPVVIE